MPGDLLVRPATKPDAGGGGSAGYQEGGGCFGSLSWERQLQELEFIIRHSYHHSIVSDSVGKHNSNLVGVNSSLKCT